MDRDTTKGAGNAVAAQMAELRQLISECRALWDAEALQRMAYDKQVRVLAQRLGDVMNRLVAVELALLDYGQLMETAAQLDAQGDDDETALAGH